MNIRKQARDIRYCMDEGLLSRGLSAKESMEVVGVSKDRPARPRHPGLIERLYEELNVKGLLKKSPHTVRYDRVCFCCGKKMDTSCPYECDKKESSVLPPSDGTGWETRGNYGSTIWDVIGPREETLHIVICDKCLVKNADRARRIVRHTKTEVLESDVFKTYREQQIAGTSRG